MEFVWLVFEGETVVAVCNTQENAEHWIGGYVDFNCQWEPKGSGKGESMRSWLRIEQRNLLTSIP
jgi:hypothetical protein